MRDIDLIQLTTDQNWDDYQLFWNSAEYTEQNFVILIYYSFIPRIQEIEDDFKAGKSSEVSCSNYDSKAEMINSSAGLDNYFEG